MKGLRVMLKNPTPPQHTATLARIHAVMDKAIRCPRSTTRANSISMGAKDSTMTMMTNCAVLDAALLLLEFMGFCFGYEIQGPFATAVVHPFPRAQSMTAALNRRTS